MGRGESQSPPLCQAVPLHCSPLHFLSYQVHSPTYEVAGVGLSSSFIVHHYCDVSVVFCSSPPSIFSTTWPHWQRGNGGSCSPPPFQPEAGGGGSGSCSSLPVVSLAGRGVSSFHLPCPPNSLKALSICTGIRFRIRCIENNRTLNFDYWFWIVG